MYYCVILCGHVINWLLIVRLKVPSRGWYSSSSGVIKNTRLSLVFFIIIGIIKRSFLKETLLMWTARFTPSHLPGSPRIPHPWGFITFISPKKPDALLSYPFYVSFFLNCLTRTQIPAMIKTACAMYWTAALMWATSWSTLPSGSGSSSSVGGSEYYCPCFLPGLG